MSVYELLEKYRQRNVELILEMSVIKEAIKLLDVEDEVIEQINILVKEEK